MWTLHCKIDGREICNRLRTSTFLVYIRVIRYMSMKHSLMCSPSTPCEYIRILVWRTWMRGPSYMKCHSIRAARLAADLIRFFVIKVYGGNMCATGESGWCVTQKEFRVRQMISTLPVDGLWQIWIYPAGWFSKIRLLIRISVYSL